MESVAVSVLAAAVTAGTPILYATLGELFAERAGVLNLGVEGMMLVGAVSGLIVTVHSSNHWLGLLAAMVAGGLMALIHAVLTVSLRANQVVSGLALTIFGTGLSAYLGKNMIGIPVPSPFESFELGFLSHIPLIGKILFQHDVLVYLTYLLVPFYWYYLYQTPSGLNLRAAGENPGATDAAGLNVNRIRYSAVCLGGVLAGIGGAYLSLAYAPSWLENMTAGRGWIAVALVIFATWDPLRAMLGAYLFGGIEALGFRLQAVGITVSPFYLKMLPYLFTILVLILVTSSNRRLRVGAPAALGLPFEREER
ncbi:MAG TPA: ABC transporter permease [Syntrophomonadaceae bacterium]|nr:ABC transporter permease [Syntrophomonadaceae bacterium]